MIALLLLSLFMGVLTQTNNQLPIRAGVVQLQMGSYSQAGYSILYNQKLLDSLYNSLVSVSYANNLEISHGLVLESKCPNMTVTGLGCTVTANSANQNNIVYVSYVVSDLGSLLVGSYQQTFSFQNTTSIVQTLTFKPLVDNSYINNSNALFVNFYPFIAGVSTLDADFSLIIDSKQFNSQTLEISFSLTIKEMHAKNVTVTFGYLLYDASIISVSRYSGQRLTPNNIASGYIYGIASIIPQTTLSKRRLQVVPNTPPGPLKTSPPFPPPSVPSLPIVSAADAASVNPTVVSHKSTSSSKSSPSSSVPSSAAGASSKAPIAMAAMSMAVPARITAPPTPSPVVLLLKSQPNQVVLTPRNVNGTLYVNYMQPDGVIDANRDQLKTLQTLGVVPYPPAPAQSAPGEKSLQGIDNQLFNTLFSTNGFVIMTTADDVDQIYYYEVNPVQGYATPAAIPAANPATIPPAAIAPTIKSATTDPAAVYYASTVTNDVPIIYCPRGVIAGKERQVDYVQEKMVLGCYACQLGMYFDLIRKTCQPFPNINNFLNQVDTLL